MPRDNVAAQVIFAKPYLVERKCHCERQEKRLISETALMGAQWQMCIRAFCLWLFRFLLDVLPAWQKLIYLNLHGTLCIIQYLTRVGAQCRAIG